MYSMARISLLLALLVVATLVEAQKRKTPAPARRLPTAAPCPPIPHVQNGAGLLGNGIVNFVCAAGFVLQGTNVITCVNGRWTVAPRCVQQICPVPLSVPFATFVTGSQGTSATYTCQSGFQINGPSTIFCNMASRSWPQPPVCNPVVAQTCPAPPSIANGLSTVNADGTVATYSCSPSFSLIGNTQIFCQNFVWTPAAPLCQLNPGVIPPSNTSVVCSRPPCGGVTIEPAATADTSQVGFQVTYTCISGYRIAAGPLNPSSLNTITSVQIACLSSGQWETPPMCEPKSCGAPPQVPNANPVTAGNLNVGDRVEYSCAAGFTFAAGSGAIAGNTVVQRTCQIDGTLSGTTPVCQQLLCLSSQFTSLTNTNPVSQNAIVGTSVSVSCSGGYIISPQATVGATVNTFSISCQLSTTSPQTAVWVVPAGISCVYQTPVSCKQFYKLYPSAMSPTSAQIDLDGPGSSYSPTPVTCSNPTSATVCTEIPSISGTPQKGVCSPSNAALPGLTTSNSPAPSATTDSYVLCPASFTPVFYSTTASFLTSLISNTAGSCSQKVTWDCSVSPGNNLLNTDNMFIALKLSGVQMSYVYNIYDPAVVDTTNSVGGLIGQRSTDGICDCKFDVQSCSRCKCAALTTGTAQDTITLPLSSTQPYFVESVLFGEEDSFTAGAVTPEGAAYTSMATIGNVKCCETL